MCSAHGSGGDTTTWEAKLRLPPFFVFLFFFFLRAAQEKKKTDEAKMYAAIDYDNPEPVTIDTGFFTKDIGAKVGS